ncbi:spore germination protein [Paenibacillus crassostreae]|uniref:Spore gernimation protein KA n=1 Tax=Paenibacillus crassostreae TaxID=1763538 RepID=A0A167GJ37_9BACL|nr:spore germination protein [Paenibacillus crassostreae]AOZ92159.1 spore germination protein [Paenibacillus crassostreae]OAB77620.1 spore gernimation protein KA [Paenibacillus crassostreae]
MNLFNREIKKTFSNSKQEQTNSDENQPKEPLKFKIQENIQYIKTTLGNSSDIVIREIQIDSERKIKAAILYTDGLSDSKSIQNFIMESLMLNFHNKNLDQLDSSKENSLQLIKDHILTVGELKNITEFNTLFTSLLSGNAILLLDDYNQGFSIGMRGWKDRAVTETTTETVIRGPKEGFNENLRTNTALIRRKIKDPNLWLETKEIGTITKTSVSIMYIKGIADDSIVKEVHSRLDRIDIDGILESGYIEELIQDETYTPFPTIYHSERPDVIAAELLEGRIAILVDGTPIVLVVPITIVNFLQAAEDYYQRADISTLIRLLRFLSIFISLLGPSLYIAITTFHQEMLPTQLLISLAAQREGVPFPAFIEAIMMEVSFEILREASLRLPKAIAQSISIVGTLVIGTAAVEAGIISASMVIVVAITAISSFVIPAYDFAMAIRMLRFLMMMLAASFGLFGIIIGIIAIMLHLCSLRSFGIPYMSPFAPFILDDQKDALLRLPQWAMFSRPRLVSQKNNIRAQSTPPKKPQDDIGG